MQSSHSEGLHLYLPLSKPIPTFAASCFLKKTLENAGFKIKDGQLETFPNCKYFNQNKITDYKAHRLPLQPESGSFLLGDDLETISDDPRVLLKQMDWVAENKNIVDEQLEEAIEVAKQAVYCERVSRKKAKASLEAWKRDLESYIKRGWTKSGQTNELLCKFATYGVVFMGLKGEELEGRIKEMVENAPGYEEHCNHKHEIDKRIRDRRKGAEKYYWAIGEVPKRIGTYKDIFGNIHEATNKNKEKAKKTLSRLKAVVKHIRQKIEIIPKTLTEFRTLVIETSKRLFGEGFGNKTLNKECYAQEWKPVYEELKANQIVINIPEEETTLEEKVEEIIQEEIQKVVQEEKIEDIVQEEIQSDTKEVKKAETAMKQGRYTPLSKEPKTETPKSPPNKGGTHLDLYEGIERAEGDVCFYRGLPSSGLIDLEGFQYPQIRMIQSNQLVKIVSTSHSSNLRDIPPKQKLVYVQPLEISLKLTEDWKEKGIVVKQSDLEKLDIPIEQLKVESIISLTNRLKIDGDRQKVDKKNLSKLISQEFVGGTPEDFW